MVLRVLRKMYKNKFTVTFLLIGVLLAVALTSSIPMYLSAIQNRILVKYMDESYKATNNYPGSISVTFPNCLMSKVMGISSYNTDIDIPIYNKYKNENAIINENVREKIEEYNLDIMSTKDIISTPQLSLWDNNINPLNINKNFEVKESTELVSIFDVEKHLEIKTGKMYSDKIGEDNIIEGIIDVDTFNRGEFEIGKVYRFTQQTNGLSYEDIQEKCISEQESKLDPMLIKVVGVFDVHGKSSFWVTGTWRFGEGKQIFISPNANISFLEQETSKSDSRIKEYNYFSEYYTNYKNIRYSTKQEFENLEKKHRKDFTNQFAYFNNSLVNMMNRVTSDFSKVNSVLWIMFAPIFIMLICYIAMVSGVIVEKDKNEISLLKSRGANLKDIVISYLIEGIILGVISIVFGPLLGKYIVRVMGSSDGFLEFVNRGALKVDLSLKAYIYSIGVVVLFLITLLIPVIISSKDSIVERKQNKSRANKKSFWKRYYLDLILIGISLYAYMNFKNTKRLVDMAKVNADKVPIDPFMYMATTMFAIGIGLLILRLFPYFVKLIYRIGKKAWSAEMYAALLNISRSAKQKEYIMLFIILTLSIGVFDINAAMGMNNGGKDNYKYLNGADVVFKSSWKKEYIGENKKQEPTSAAEALIGTDEEHQYELYIEPNLKEIVNIEGVEKYTKVYLSNETALKYRNVTVPTVKLMSVVSDEFGEVSWFRKDLLPIDWYNYLNALASDKHSILLSSSFKEFGIGIGDTIKLSVSGNMQLDFVVCGLIDYWPSWDKNENKFFAVSNFNYLYSTIPIAPYEVWLKLEQETSSKDVYDRLIENGVALRKFSDVNTQVVKFKNDVFVQGINAAYTIGFIGTVCVSVLGFLIYWILSIKDRELQFGILRSLGLKKKKLYSMVVIEQILVTGVSVLLGLGIGNLISVLFGKIANVGVTDKSNILPQYVYNSFDEKLKLILGTIIIIVLIIIIFIRYISKLKIDQAVKLGED